MSRKLKEKTTPPVPAWENLRPAVTDKLLSEVTQRIVEKFKPHKVVLFGSFAYGEPTHYSDVDLLVVMDSTEPIARRIMHVAQVAKVRFLPMDLLVHTPAEIEERLAKGDFFMAEILTKGRVLYQRESA